MLAPVLGPVPATPGLPAPPTPGAWAAPAPSGLAATPAANGTVLLLLVFVLAQPATTFLALEALVGLAVNPAGPVIGAAFVGGTEVVAGP